MPLKSNTLYQHPQTILYNAKIITMNTNQPRAQALAITDGRIAAIGDDADVRALAVHDTRQMDMEGRTILPGFIDAHCHVVSTGLLHLRCVRCDLPTIPDILQALRTHAQKVPAGEWVAGFLYDDTKTAERRFLTREELDAALPHHPAVVMHRGGHTAYVNSLALERAGISETTADPPGGRFERHPADGRLSGRVCETAQDPILALLPDAFTPAERQQAVVLVARMMNQAGITSAHDMWASPLDLKACQDACHAGELTLRMNFMMFYPYLETLLQAGVRSGLGDSWVRVGGLKLVCDGSIAERTAFLSSPYVGRPGDHGILVMGEDELYAYAEKAHRAGWQIGVHANGDAAIDIVLRVYERLQREYPRPDARFRLEHCTLLNENLIQRIRTLKALPIPFGAYVYFRGEVMPEYGADRLERMFALRSLLDAGIPVAIGSDYPPGPFEPLMALQSAVTRRDMQGKEWGPSQRISVEEALRTQTLHGAYASFEENIKGSLEPGKLADLVVLSRDPLMTEPDDLVNIKVEGTMVQGKWVYER